MSGWNCFCHWKRSPSFRLRISWSMILLRSPGMESFSRHDELISSSISAIEFAEASMKVYMVYEEAMSVDSHSCSSFSISLSFDCLDYFSIIYCYCYCGCCCCCGYCDCCEPDVLSVSNCCLKERRVESRYMNEESKRKEEERGIGHPKRGAIVLLK